MDKILYKNTLLGVRIKRVAKGTHPISDADEPLQVLTLNLPKDTEIRAHMHTPTIRTTHKLQECIIVLRGKVRVDLYGEGTTILKRVTIKEREAFITMFGGHRITILEDAEIIETKNGPFKNDRVNLS